MMDDMIVIIKTTRVYSAHCADIFLFYKYLILILL